MKKNELRSELPFIGRAEIGLCFLSFLSLTVAFLVPTAQAQLINPQFFQALQNQSDPNNFGCFQQNTQSANLAAVEGFLSSNTNLLSKRGLQSSANEAIGRIQGRNGGASQCGSTKFEYDLDANSCGTFQSNGVYSETKSQELKSKLDAAVKAQACQKGSLEYLQKEFKCLQDFAQQNYNALNQYDSQFQKTFQQWSTDSSQYQSNIQARQTQITELSQKLGADVDEKGKVTVSGDKGFYGVQKAIREMQNRLTSGEKGQGFQNEVLSIYQIRKNEQNKNRIYVQMMTFASAKQCFQTFGAPFLCSRSVAKSDFTSYLGCMAASSSQYRKNSNGNFEQDQRTGTKTAAAAVENVVMSGVGGLLAQIPDLSSVPQPAQSGQPDQQSLPMPKGITTMAQFDSYANSYLAGAPALISTNGTAYNVKDMVTERMHTCYQTASATLANDPIFQQSQTVFKSNLDGFDRSINDQIETMHNQFAGTFAFITKEFGGQAQVMAAALGVPKALCQSGEAGFKECMIKIKAALDEVLTVTPLSIAVKGNTQTANARVAKVDDFYLNCAGVNDCISKIEKQYIPQLGKAIQTESSSAQTFVKKSNQETDQQVTSLRKLVKQQNQFIDGRLRNANQMMVALGVSADMTVGRVQGMDFEKDETTGLPIMPKPPQSVLNVIGGGLPDMENDPFGKMSTELSQKVKSMGDDEKELQAKVGKFETAKSSCKKSGYSKRVSDLQKKMQRFNDAGCNYDSSFCKGKRLKGIGLVESVYADLQSKGMSTSSSSSSDDDFSSLDILELGYDPCSDKGMDSSTNFLKEQKTLGCKEVNGETIESLVNAALKGCSDNSSAVTAADQAVNDFNRDHPSFKALTAEQKIGLATLSAVKNRKPKQEKAFKELTAASELSEKYQSLLATQKSVKESNSTPTCEDSDANSTLRSSGIKIEDLFANEYNGTTSTNTSAGINPVNAAKGRAKQKAIDAAKARCETIKADPAMKHTGQTGKGRGSCQSMYDSILKDAKASQSEMMTNGDLEKSKRKRSKAGRAEK